MPNTKHTKSSGDHKGDKKLFWKSGLKVTMQSEKPIQKGRAIFCLRRPKQ